MDEVLQHYNDTREEKATFKEKRTVNTSKQYYRVTNVGEKPVTMTWNRFLLDETDYKSYLEYIESDEYLGSTADERAARSQIPESIKAKPFYDSLAIDRLIPEKVRVTTGKITTTQAVYTYKWVIGVDPKVLEALSSYRVEDIAEELGVKFSYKAEKKTIIDKIVKAFGHYERVLTEDQWLHSGLSNLERRRIATKKVEVTDESGYARIVMKDLYEGILVATPISEKLALEAKRLASINKHREMFKEVDKTAQTDLETDDEPDKDLKEPKEDKDAN